MNGDAQLARGRRVRRGALGLLALAVLALVAAACANAIGPPSQPQSPSSLPALRTLGGAAAGVARLASTDPSAPGTTGGSDTRGAAGPGAAASAAQFRAVTAALEPAVSAAHAVASPVPVPLPGIAPPPGVSATCAQDVSPRLQNWLNHLAAGTIVRAPAGACYLIDEGLRLVGLHDITIIGGTWEDRTVPVPNASPVDMGAEFWLVGGSRITLQNLFIAGVNPAGYDPSGAFASGIRSDGADGLTVTDVFVDHVYGDGVTLDPLRGSDDMSGTIVRPSEHVLLDNVWIDGTGRQGLTLASVSGAEITGLVFLDIGYDIIDAEADQSDEGAQNVAIDGCRVNGSVGGLFFANGGAGYGSPWTSNVSVEHCTMAAPLAGDTILIDNDESTGNQRGPFTFSNDVLRCGNSVYVSCIEVSNGNLNVSNTFVRVPPGDVHEPLYHATHDSTVVFDNDVVSGYGTPGTTDDTSTTEVQGGSWTPASGASTAAPPSTTSTSTTSTSTSSSPSSSTTTTPSPPRAATTSTTKPPPPRATTTTTAPLLSSLTGSGSNSTKRRRGSL